jgi:hypothetical protein
MPYTDLDDFSAGTDSQKEEDLNTLLLTFGGFARKTDLQSKMYGAVDGGFTGGEDSGQLNVANYCLRQELVNTLMLTQEEVERCVGYALTDRFIEETFTLGFSRKVQLKYPNVKEINVTREWALDQTLDIVFNTVDTPTVEIDGSDAFVQLPVDVVFNPTEVFIRDKASNSAYKIAQNTPITRVSGTPDYWRVPINTSVQTYDSNPIIVTDKKYVYVDVTVPTLTEGQNYQPTYLGTNQIIEQARDPQDIGGGLTRYWFYVYDLLLPDFIHELFDLSQAEFWKMYQKIDFKIWTETAFEAVITITQGATEQVVQYDSTSTDPSVQVYLVDKTLGIVHIVVDPAFIVDCVSWCDQTIPFSVKVTVSYRVSPDVLEDTYRRQISHLKKGILHATASQLLAESCGCMLENGFIAKAQQELGTVVTSHLTSIQYLADYKDRFGYKIFLDIIEKAKVYSNFVEL